MTLADRIDDAADMIERDGWYNPRLKRFGGVCPVQALSRVADFSSVDASVSWLNDVHRFGNFLGSGWGTVDAWNDAQDDPQVVLDAMRKYAKELRVLEDLG